MAAILPHWNRPKDTIASAANDFNRFLQDTRTRVLDATTSSSTPELGLHVVIGNEAADADSIVSSLVFARHLHCVHQQNKTKNDELDHLFVPVVAIPRDEFALRCDVHALLTELHVDVTSICFLDEFPWQLATKHKLLLTLLDHNAIHSVLAKRLEAIGSPTKPVQVEEIMDHHADLGQHLDALRREIAFENGTASAASCCTLVAERILQHQRQHQRQLQQEESHLALALHATLLVSVIALDSIDFNPAAKKVTPRDIAAAHALHSLAFADPKALFQWLHHEKFNVRHWRHFSLRNCLRCDYKDFAFPKALTTRYGVSSVLIDLPTFMRKAESAGAMQQEMAAFCRDQEIAFLVVMSMTMTSANVPERQILFFFSPQQQQQQSQGIEDPVRQQLVPVLTQRLGLVLQPLALVHPLEDDLGNAPLGAFAQANAALSRKQIVPLIQQALEQLCMPQAARHSHKL